MTAAPVPATGKMLPRALRTACTAEALMLPPSTRMSRLECTRQAGAWMRPLSLTRITAESVSLNPSTHRGVRLTDDPRAIASKFHPPGGSMLTKKEVRLPFRCT